MTQDTKKSRIPVLVIDPQEIALLGITQLVNSDKRFVICNTARSGVEALKAINETKPDLIILDPSLEDEDGVELIASLLKISNARVIIYTCSRNCKIVARALTEGVRGIVKKNEPVGTLIKALEKVCLGELWISQIPTPKIPTKIAQTNKATELSPEQNKLKSLTFKEEKVTRAIQMYSEKTLKQTAEILHISEHTLRNHLASIYHKLEVRNRLELYIFCGKYQKTGNPTDHPRRRSTDS
jgi:DNA-binding NarL/FixJ family response regulator